MDNTPEQAAGKMGMSVRTLKKHITLGNLGYITKGTGAIRKHIVIPDEAIEAFRRAHLRENVTRVNVDLVRQVSANHLPKAPSRY